MSGIMSATGLGPLDALPCQNGEMTKIGSFQRLSKVKLRLFEVDYVYVQSEEPLDYLLSFTVMSCRFGVYNYIMEACTASHYELSYDGVLRRIDFKFPNDRSDAVILGKICKSLTKKNISINLISGFHRDMLFVTPESVSTVKKVIDDMLGIERLVSDWG